jgi:hypothetical protein
VEQLEPKSVDSTMLKEWKRINRKQSARWQHLSWLKAMPFSLNFFDRC